MVVGLHIDHLFKVYLEHFARYAEIQDVFLHGFSLGVEEKGKDCGGTRMFLRHFWFSLTVFFQKKRTAWNFLETMPNLRLPPSYPTHSTIREVHAVKGGMNVLRHQDLLLLCDALKIGGIQDKGGGSDRKQLFSRMFFCRTDFQTGRANLQVGVYKCPPTAHPLAFCVLEIAWIMQVQRHCQENGRPKKRGVILPYSQQRMVEWWNFGMTHSATTPHCRKNERIMVTNKKSVEFWHVATLHYLRPCKPIPAEQATQSPRRYDYPPLSSKHTLSLLPKTMFWKQTFWV